MHEVYLYFGKSHSFFGIHSTAYSFIASYIILLIESLYDGHVSCKLLIYKSVSTKKTRLPLNFNEHKLVYE